MKSRTDLDGLVSVIVPFYGAAQQLVRAVESVAAQDAVVAEVIVVDDASPSGRDAIAMLQTRRWPFCLRCVRHERNLGPGGARNTAWSAADPRSVFLAFLDADDTWDRQKVAVQASWMLTHPAFAWSAHRCGSRPDSWTLPNVRFHELRVAELLRANPIATPTVMVRRGVEARFRDGWRFCEDLMLWLDLLKSGQRGALLHVPLATLGRPPTTRGGLTGMLEEMHRGELRIIETLRSDSTLSPASAVAWRSWMRIKYAVRRLTCQ